MWRFILGLTSGIYIGSYYECKPIINLLKNKILEYIPEKKNKN